MINRIFLERVKEYLYIRSLQLPGFYAGMKKAYILRSALLFFLGGWIFPSFRFMNGRYLIASIRHIELIELNKRHQLVLLGGPNEFFYAIKNGCGFINTSNLYICVTLNAFFDIKKLALLEYFAEIFLAKIYEIKELKYLIIDSDGLPYKRALCILFQALEKKVVCLQHGIFPDPYQGIDGSLCDLNIVIDSNQKTVFMNSGLKESVLVLLSEVTKEKNQSIFYKEVSPAVILVGEGWLSHDRERHCKYKLFLKKIIQHLKELNIRVVYRPHPSERFLFWEYWDLLPIETAKRSQNIFPWNIYLGTTSSLLVDSAKRGAVAIQIIDLLPIKEDYKKYGVIQLAAAGFVEYINQLNIQKKLQNQVINKKTITLELDKISESISLI